MERTRPARIDGPPSKNVLTDFVNDPNADLHLAFGLQYFPIPPGGTVNVPSYCDTDTRLRHVRPPCDPLDHKCVGHVDTSESVSVSQ